MAVGTILGVEPVAKPARVRRDELAPDLPPQLWRKAVDALSWDRPAEDRISEVREFCRIAITTWWQELTVAARWPRPVRVDEASEDIECSPAAISVAMSIGRAAATLDIETACYRLGLLYQSLQPQDHRARLGIYYTPPPLTARLIEQATSAGVDWTRARVLDPACGGGAFLAPIARRMVQAAKDRSPGRILDDIAARLVGNDIDPFGAWLSQVALDATLIPLARDAGRMPDRVVRTCDSLRDEIPCGAFDLVIGNPPYGRVRLTAAERTRFARGLFGHANLYGLFTDLALQHAKPGGVVSFVTPTSFLAGEYFKKLRLLLGKDAHPVALDFVSSRKGVFEDVLQETLLATYVREGQRRCVEVRAITPVNGERTRSERTGSFPLPDDLSTPWILPRGTGQGALTERLNRMTSRLADWGYRVSTGPLVWNRHKDQIVDEAGDGHVPLIWAEAIGSDGSFAWRAQRRGHKRFFRCRPGDDWLVIETPCVLLQRTTAKEQDRRLIAAEMPKAFLRAHGGVVVENHLNMLRPSSEAAPVPARTLAAFLNSEIADRVFRCVSGSVAVSAYELEAMPLPPLEQIKELTVLLDDGPDQTWIEAKCRALYLDGP